MADPRAPGSRPTAGGRLVPAATVIASIVLSAAIALPGATAQGPRPDLADAPVDASGLASGRFARMEMLYERTIFQVDVMRLTLRFGPGTAGELERLVAGRDYDESLADSAAEVVVRSGNVLVRSRFLRDVSLEQLLDGIRESMGDARDAGFVSPQEHDELLPRIVAQYEPLRDRGVREGETMWYRIRGDTFRVVLEALDGSLLVDRTSEGAKHRRALLGGYMAPDSDFREPLVRSLLRRGER